MDLLDNIRNAGRAHALGSVSALYLTFRYQGKIEQLQRTTEACRMNMALGLIHATLLVDCIDFDSMTKNRKLT